jgi:uncharacterized membrane protein
MLFEFTRALIAVIAALSAFVAPLVMLAAVPLGFAELNQTLEIIKTWLAYIGPFAGTVLGFYFHRDNGRGP